MIGSPLPERDEVAFDTVTKRASEVLRPAGALRRLDEVAAWLAGWQRTDRPRVERPAAIVFAAGHGVANRGVSAYPKEITAEMLRALRGGVATANVMAEQLGIHLSIVDAGVGTPTGDITVEDALSPSGFTACWDAGRGAVAELDTDLLVFGEMGIGNTTPAAAVACALFGMRAEDWTGRGTGVDDPTYEHKIALVEQARRRVDGDDPLEILRRAGGSELTAIAGATYEARLRSIPVVLDGFVVTASVAPLAAAVDGALAHCIAGHCSTEPGHRMLLDKLGFEPLLDLDLRLGEGSGALAAIPLIKLAAACVTEVATFSEWGLE